MLRIDIHAERQSATLHCAGRIVLGVEIEILRCMADTRNEACLILDLGKVDAIDAAGLGLLVELHCGARSRNATLRITKTSPGVHRIIELVNLQSVLEVEAGEADWDDNDETQSPCGRSLTA
jgi:HptB-dependent secretion and biofilm anti anti-sigma factor